MPVSSPSASGARRPPFAPATDISLSSTRSHLTGRPGRLRLCLAFPYLCCSRRLLPHQPQLFSPASCIRRTESRPPRHRVHSDCKGTRPGHPLETSAEAKKHSGLGRPEKEQGQPVSGQRRCITYWNPTPTREQFLLPAPRPCFLVRRPAQPCTGLRHFRGTFSRCLAAPDGPGSTLCEKLRRAGRSKGARARQSMPRVAGLIAHLPRDSFRLPNAVESGTIPR